MFNQENLLFLQRENHHHRSLCHWNVNKYFVPLNKYKRFDFEKELSSRQDSLAKRKLQSIQNTGNNEPLSEQAETLYYRTHAKVSEYNQILNESHQTKSDLEDSKEENLETEIFQARS